MNCEMLISAQLHKLYNFTFLEPPSSVLFNSPLGFFNGCCIEFHRCNPQPGFLLVFFSLFVTYYFMIIVAGALQLLVILKDC